MASSRVPTCRLKLAITIAFIFVLAFLPLLTVGYGERVEEEREKKMVIGSRPPRCVNKCSSCRPCMATLVIPAHSMNGFEAPPRTSRREEDDNYYLLSWKCRCGDELYQP